MNHRLSDTTKLVLSVVLFLIILVGGIYGVWSVKRWFNYNFGYASQVQAEVKSQTDPLRQELEALKLRVNALEQKNPTK